MKVYVTPIIKLRRNYMYLGRSVDSVFVLPKHSIVNTLTDVINIQIMYTQVVRSISCKIHYVIILLLLGLFDDNEF
jgi:hypothetical protein